MDRFFTEIRGTGSPEGRMFPAPLKVDRFLYVSLVVAGANPGAVMFPAPLKVDRFLYL